MAEIQTFTQQIVASVKQIDFSGQDPSRPSMGDCPLCKGAVLEFPKSFSCSKWRQTGCSFVIWKTIAGRKIKGDEAKQLLGEGKTARLGGFKSKAGKEFDTTLVLKEGKVVFQF